MPIFDSASQEMREVEIVAAEQKMAADGGACELDPVALAVDADQREIAGAAADIADEHRLPSNNSLFERARWPAIQA